MALLPAPVTRIYPTFRAAQTAVFDVENHNGP